MKFWDFDYMGRTKKKQEEARNKALRAQKEQLEADAKRLKHEAIDRWMEEAASLKTCPPLHTSGSTIISPPGTGISFSPSSGSYYTTVVGVDIEAIMAAKRLFMVLGLEFTVENVKYLTKEIENL